MVIGGFVSETSLPPTPEASEAEDEDDDVTNSENNDDGDASTFSIDEMST